MCRGHFCVAGDILFRRGTCRACGDGNAVPDGVERPCRKDTHPAAWNVPVVGDGQLDAGAQSRRTHLKARGLYPQGPCS